MQILAQSPRRKIIYILCFKVSMDNGRVWCAIVYIDLMY